jgi:non-ribosomal peptide synthetase component F
METHSLTIYFYTYIIALPLPICFHSPSSGIGRTAFGTHTRVLQLARSSFDIHYFEYVGTLAMGGTLVLLPESFDRAFDTSVLLRVARKHAVNWMFCVPSVAALILNEVRSEESRAAALPWNHNATTVAAADTASSDTSSSTVAIPSLSESSASSTASSSSLASSTAHRRTRKPLPHLRQLYIGGEAVAPALMLDLHAALHCQQMHHVYGPAECTMYALSWPFDARALSDPSAAALKLPLGDPYHGYGLAFAPSR